MAERISDEKYFEQRAAQLKQELDEGFPEAWIPENPGEALVGVLKGTDVGHTPWGPRRIAIFEDAETRERRSLWILHTALESQFQRANPVIGELVAVRYEGKVQSRDGKNQYENWTVKVDRPEGAVDWTTPPGAQAAVSPSPPPRTAPGGQRPTQQAQQADPGPDASYQHADDDIPFAPTIYDNTF